MSLQQDCEVCQNCGCEPCKCGSLAIAVYAPNNSADILSPAPSDELMPDPVDAEEEGGGGPETPTSDTEMSCQGPLAADFTAPAIGANGTITITGAGTFAAAGGYIWIPGIGYLLVNSASTDTLAVTNRDIAQGTVINAGTMAWFQPPIVGAVVTAALASLCVSPGCGCAPNPDLVGCVDALFGCKDGEVFGYLSSEMRSLLSPFWNLPAGSEITVIELGTGDEAAYLDIEQTFAAFSAPEGATHAIVRAELCVDDNPAGNIAVDVSGKEVGKLLQSLDESYFSSLAFAKIEAGPPIHIKWEMRPNAAVAASFGPSGFLKIRIVGYAAMTEL